MKKGQEMMEYQDVVTDIKQIIVSGQQYAYQAANKAMVLTYWQIGKRIVEQEQKGEERAEYGKAFIAYAVGRFDRRVWKKLFKKKFAIFS